MTDIFIPRTELKIGRIIEVNGNSLRIELDKNINELVRTVDGRNYSIGQVGSIIKIHFGRKILFAFVRLLRMRSEIIDDNDQRHINPSDDARILDADLFGQGNWSKASKNLEFTRGVEIYPLPLQHAYLCLNKELESVYKAAEYNATLSDISPMVSIGHYIGSNNAVCRANIDKLFGHHFAILGSTGSGKSGTVASILHSILDYESVNGGKLKPRIIIIDPHGEYAKAFGDQAMVYKAYNDASATDADGNLLQLPYWLMSGDEFRSLIIGKTEYEATSQNNIVYEALTYSRQVQSGLVKDVGDDPAGGIIASNQDGVTDAQILNFDRDKPAPFKLSQFEKHVSMVQGRKANKTENLAPSSRDKIDSILKKLKVLRSNPQLKFMLDEYSEETSPKLKEILAQFISDDNGKNIRIVDISGLPNEVAGPLTALISRLLFQYKLWQTKDERKKDPILFICEEAHRYVPNHGEAQYKEAQEAIRRIAKEGRKYGLGLGLISQRPSDVESTVLSQCNSWIILRLTNSGDQAHVAKFLPDSLSGLTKMLPALTRREALFVGEAAALPSRIRINKLPEDKLPDSNDICFAEGWLNEPIDDDSLQKIVERWCYQT